MMLETPALAATGGWPNAARRGFLHGLAALPMIGGGVTLIGQPTAVAEPASIEMLEAYKTWLDFERRALSWEIAGDPIMSRYYRSFGDDQASRFSHVDRTFAFIGDSGSYHSPRAAHPSSRAALVLSAVGCDWR